MLIIPLIPAASQQLGVTLASLPCQLKVKTRTTGLFLDISINDVPALDGVICLDRVRMVRDAYLGFPGDLFFADTEGRDDPTFDGLGSRFLLVYLAPGETPPRGVQ